MQSSSLVLLVALALPLGAVAKPPAPVAASARASSKVPAYVTRAMADPARAADRKDDARRQMAAVLAFTGVKPGDAVLELAPGTGYWTRAFSQIVGPSGHVYQLWPQQWAKHSAKSMDLWKKLAATSHYANVTPVEESLAMVSVPHKVDVVFTADNYHDLHDPFSGPVAMGKFNQQIFASLKPGGVFVIVDHAAPAGSGTADTNTLHRIDPASVKQEVEAAGFVFDGASDALLNPKDPLTVPVFDKSIRGHTSQFIYRFRKPEK